MPSISAILSRPRPLIGLAMALSGALIITPDTLLIRLSGLEGWGLTVWRGLLIGFSVMFLWLVTEGRDAASQIPRLLTIPAISIMVASTGSTLAFNFATIETSITVVLTALATTPVLAAGLSFLILREAAPLRTWVASLSVPAKDVQLLFTTLDAGVLLVITSVPVLVSLAVSMLVALGHMQVSFATAQRTRLTKFRRNVISFAQETPAFAQRVGLMCRYEVGDRVNSTLGPGTALQTTEGRVKYWVSADEAERRAPAAS